MSNGIHRQVANHRSCPVCACMPSRARMTFSKKYMPPFWLQTPTAFVPLDFTTATHKH
jgi:hypothetical protein